MKSIFVFLAAIACISVVHAERPDNTDADCELQRPELNCEKKFLFFKYKDSGCEDKKSMLVAIYELQREHCIASQRSVKDYRNSVAQLRGRDQLGKANGEQCLEAIDCESGYCFPGPPLPSGQMKYCMSESMNCAFNGKEGVNYRHVINISGEKYICAIADRGNGSYWKRLSSGPTKSTECINSSISESKVNACKNRDQVTIYTGRDQRMLENGESLCFEPRDQNWQWSCGNAARSIKPECKTAELIQAGRSKSGDIVTWLCLSTDKHRNETVETNAPSQLSDSLIGVWEARKIDTGGTIIDTFSAVLKVDEAYDDQTYTGELSILRRSKRSGRGRSVLKVDMLIDPSGFRVHPISVEKLSGDHSITNYVPDFMELRLTDEGHLKGTISDSNRKWGKIVFRKDVP